MRPSAAVIEHEIARPAPPLASLVRRSSGYRYSGLPPGTHLGLPSPSLTLVVSLGPRTRLARMPDPAQRPADFNVLVGGLHCGPAVLAHDGELFGIQLDLTPAGARALLGLPAGELASRVVALDDVVGGSSAERLEAAAEASTWPERLAIVEGALLSRLERQPMKSVRPELEQAWRLMVAAGRSPRVSEVARAVGWSRRHLLDSFLAEYGVSPKQLGRIARFHRSKQILQRSPAANLAQVAAGCGYCDQSHLDRDWKSLAGCAPSRWLRSEELSFFQDKTHGAVAGLSA